MSDLSIKNYFEDKMKAPFALDDVEWRVQQSGHKDRKPWAMVLCYVTNRAIMKRLDDVVGAMNWKNEYKPSPDGGVLCGISIYCGEKKEWITKWDGAENTQIDAVKGGLSGSMKRAAVQWGIGRYLYRLEAAFAKCHLDKKGKHRGSMLVDKNNKNSGYIYYTWDEPNLPSWALPEKSDDVSVRDLMGDIKAISDIQSVEHLNELWRSVSPSYSGEDFEKLKTAAARRKSQILPENGGNQ